MRWLRSAVAILLALVFVASAVPRLDHEHTQERAALAEVECRVDHQRAAADRAVEGRAAAGWPVLEPAGSAHAHRCEACRRDSQRNLGLGEPPRAVGAEVALSRAELPLDTLRPTLRPNSHAPRGPPRS